MMALNTFDHQEIFQTARQLPFTIRFSLLEMLMQSLREDLNLQPDAQIRMEMPIEPCTLKQKLRGHEVRGIAKANGHMQSKAQFREEYTDYLIQKYS